MDNINGDNNGYFFKKGRKKFKCDFYNGGNFFTTIKRYFQFAFDQFKKTWIEQIVKKKWSRQTV